jgi:hypothetical protein
MGFVDTFLNLDVILRVMPMLWRGVGNTIWLALATLFFGGILGVVMCLPRTRSPSPRTCCATPTDAGGRTPTSCIIPSAALPGKEADLAQAMAEFASVWAAPDDKQWGYVLRKRQDLCRGVGAADQRAQGLAHACRQRHRRACTS